MSFSIFAIGNNKIPDDTVMYNFSGYYNCPSRELGLCKLSHCCYAKKEEAGYRPAVLGMRDIQTIFFDDCSVELFMAMFRQVMLPKRKVPIEHFRFSEAGDFFTQKQVDKFTEICRRIKKEFPHINIYGYTARRDLDFTQLKKLATINGQFHRQNNTIIVCEKLPAKAKFVCAGDCSMCDHCKHGNGRKIYIKKH